MYCFQDNYTYYISFDGGSAYNIIYVDAPVKIIYEREVNQKFVRAKSGEWIIRRRGNEGSYDALLAILDAADSATAEVRVKIISIWEAYNTHSPAVTREYFHVNLTGLSVDEDLGIIKFTPDPVDSYRFWDEHKDE